MTFFPNLFFDCNFPGNDNQTFNVYTERTPSIYRKFFPVLKFAVEDFLCRKKCCEYYGPEGVAVLAFILSLLLFHVQQSYCLVLVCSIMGM